MQKASDDFGLRSPVIQKQFQTKNCTSIVAFVPHTRAVCAKIAKFSGGEGEPTQDGAIEWGHQPTQTNAGTDEEGVSRPQALPRYMGSSSTG